MRTLIPSDRFVDRCILNSFWIPFSFFTTNWKLPPKKISNLDKNPDLESKINLWMFRKYHFTLKPFAMYNIVIRSQKIYSDSYFKRLHFKLPYLTFHSLFDNAISKKYRQNYTFRVKLFQSIQKNKLMKGPWEFKTTQWMIRILNMNSITSSQKSTEETAQTSTKRTFL